MKTELPKLLTAREVAQALRVSEGTVRRLAGNGALPALRVGSNLRFVPEAVAHAVGADEATFNTLLNLAQPEEERTDD
jgi:excisionase family DNA binding protein